MEMSFESLVRSRPGAVVAGTVAVAMVNKMLEMDVQQKNVKVLSPVDTKSRGVSRWRSGWGGREGDSVMRMTQYGIWGRGPRKQEEERQSGTGTEISHSSRFSYRGPFHQKEVSASNQTIKVWISKEIMIVGLWSKWRKSGNHYLTPDLVFRSQIYLSFNIGNKGGLHIA